MTALLWWLATAAYAESPTPNARFTRTCNVYTQAAVNSPVACLRRSGAPVVVQSDPTNTFVRISSQQCEGFVPNGCIGMDAVLRRTPVSLGPQKADRFRVGVTGHIDGVWSSVPSSTTSGQGFSFAGGLAARLPLGRSLSLTFSPSYRVYRIVRSVDGSGIVLDPNPASFTQSLSYAGAAGLLGLRVGEGTGVVPFEWWLSGGLEYLHPLSGTQTDNLTGRTVDVGFKDRLFLLLLGPSLVYPLSPSTVMVSDLAAYYNLASAQGYQVVGARLSLAIQLSL